jgi:hypothetical protein
MHQKVTPQDKKILVCIVLRPNKRIPTSPKDMAFFLDEIPLQMAKKSSKIPILGKTIGK